MNRLVDFVAKELRKIWLPTIVFLFLFHMIALTRAVVLGDYSVVALRATTATVGALLVAKAILVVEALPISAAFVGRGIVHLLWKTLLFGVLVLVFRFVDEALALAAKHGGVVQGIKAMPGEVSWPAFLVLTLWVLGGLFFYCLLIELMRAAGARRVREIVFGAGGTVDGDGLGTSKNP